MNLPATRSSPHLPSSGPSRSTAANHGDDWIAERNESFEYANSEPSVLVIGAGHCGLGVAARLKYLGVSTLLVDSHARIGDNWRQRYDALCLHDPVCK